MKNNKVFLLLFVLICSISVNVQSQSDWSTSGNSLYSSDFLGSTNNIDLKFKVNNQLGGLINMSAYNTFLGYTAGNAITSGTNNTFMGYESGKLNTTGTYNTAVGSKALNANTTGNYNAAIGYYSLYTNQTGVGNTAVGHASLYLNTGDYNTALGTFSLRSNSSGTSNTAIGYNSMYSNTSGSTNTAIGLNSLYYNTTASANVAIGCQTLLNNRQVRNNTAIGYQALYTMSYNTAFDADNVAIGYQALYSNQPISTSTGYRNTAIGTYSLYSNTTGTYNTSTGYKALYNNRNNSNNTAIGSQALYTMSYNTTAFNGENVAVGHQALYSNQPTASDNGYRNTAVGTFSMYSNSTGSNNTGLGYLSLFWNNGAANTAVGCSALEDNSSGYGNTAMGWNALANNNSGNSNTAIGSGALNFNTSGNYNSALGALADVDYNNLNGTTALGYNARTTAENQIKIGTSANTDITGGYGAWHNFSDGRFKENIKEDVPGLIFIKKLRPITYTFDAQKIDEFIGIKQRMDTIKDENAKKRYYERLKEVSALIQTGFIAQEVEATANEIGYSFDGVHKPVNEKDNYTIGYSTFVVPLVKAVQEQQGMIDSMKTKIKNQETISDSLQNLINKQQTMIDTSKIAKLNERLTLLEALVNECCSKNSGEKKLIMQDVELSDAQAIVLDQNVPNPFAESTIISYFIPENVSSAQIIFTDNTGKVLKTVKITEKGKGMLKVFGQDLSSGIYSYTLVADGKTIDSKNMIKLK